MRSSLSVFIMVYALASAQTSHAQSSFGPEISAEDFHLHLWALRSPGFAGRPMPRSPDTTRMLTCKLSSNGLG